MNMEFKKLELEQEESWIKRVLTSKHTIKTAAYIIAGAGLSFLYYYLTEGRHTNLMATGDILRSVFLGGLFGFFVTNSPCARNRC